MKNRKPSYKCIKRKGYEREINWGNETRTRVTDRTTRGKSQRGTLPATDRESNSQENRNSAANEKRRDRLITQNLASAAPYEKTLRRSLARNVRTEKGSGSSDDESAWRGGLHIYRKSVIQNGEWEKTQTLQKRGASIED